jgi:hypothetical protein
MVGTMLCCAPPRALWRASAGWDTANDGCMRGKVLVRRLGCYGETAAWEDVHPHRVRHKTDLRPMQR